MTHATHIKTAEQARILSEAMGHLAGTYPNDQISNALSRVSQKLESFGAPFAVPLSDLDHQIISFFHSYESGLV